MTRPGKRKLACADFTFPLLDHDSSLALIAMLGMDGADIGLFEGRSHLWPSREYRNPARSGRALGRKLSNLGLRTADIFLQMAPDFRPFAINHPESSRRRKARDWFVRTLEYASAAGSRHVSALPGVAFEDQSPAASMGRSIEELAWRVEQARNHRLTFGVEAHVGSIVPTPAGARKLVESVPGLTLTLDYTHFTRAGMKDAQVEPLTKYASHIHVRGARRGRLQASFKDNVIDYARLVRRLDAAGYKGYLGIEYVWIDWEHCNEVDNVAETVRFRDFLRRL